ncbi:MAG: hypothetical protein RSD22_09280 [Romboutsia sp.]
MNSYIGKCEGEKIYTCCDFDIRNMSDCDKYKKKSDELYHQAQCIHEESKKLLCESKELSEESKRLDQNSKQLCAKANIVWDEARKLDAEASNLLDLASFYGQKASECAKNTANFRYKPSCNGECYKSTCDTNRPLDCCSK